MIKDASYVKSLTNIIDIPDDLPQVLLLGRSNVGKSSFINSLTNRKNLARTSNTPGKTITLNFYLINQQFFIVDAPGYGYARRSKSKKDEFIIMLENFLLTSKQLKLICLLVDFKVGPTEDDILTYDFVKATGIDFMVIATKKDKIPNTHQHKQEKLIKEKLKFPHVFYSYSSVSKVNLDPILSHILNSVRENKDE
jgi:GTP-binding protein